METETHKPAQLAVLARWAAIVATLVVLALLATPQARSDVKGPPASAAGFVICLLTAVVAATLCRHYWRAWMAPFVAGIAGAFAIGNQFWGPYGGAAGFFAGMLVALWPSHRRSL